MRKSDDGTAITSSYSGEDLSFVEETVDITIHAAKEYHPWPTPGPGYFLAEVIRHDFERDVDAR